MRITLVILVWLGFTVGCGDTEKTKPTIHKLSDAEFDKRYEQLLARIKTTARKTSLEKIPAYMETCLADSIFDYWYGTRWNFYGTSVKPQRGTIACGYFVTTTLQQLGLDIDRVFLAQQASSEIIKKVCDENTIQVFTNSRYKKMIAHVKQHPGKVFIVGLDNHVGYLVKQNNQLYFVHSGGGHPLCVIKEKAERANHLKWSKYHMVGHINFSRWARALKGAN